MKKKFVGWVVLVSCAFGQAPVRRVCASDTRYKELWAQSAEFRDVRQSLLQFTNAFEAVRKNSRVALRTAPIVIPVVVHVVFKDASQNISDAQIQSQIEVLNRDYMRANSDISGVPSMFTSSIGNPRLQFKLATRDPQGNATTGITRTQTDRDSFDSEGPNKDFMKFAAKGGHDAWNRDQYLNLWVCRLAPTSAGQVLGYGTFPGEAADVDGVVIMFTAFGTSGTAAAPFNLGRTLTHEVGHWLNLFHIWGDDSGSCTGSDQVEDTPNQGDFSLGCPNPATPPSSCGVKNMTVNYMDYSEDACMFMFTAGQVARIEATMAGARLALTTSAALNVQ
jgi:hypothetical protein